MAMSALSTSFIICKQHHLTFRMLQSSAARHGTARHSTARHGTARHGTAQHGTAQHSTAQHTHHHLINLLSLLLFYLNVKLLLFSITQITNGECATTNLIINTQHIVVKHVQCEMLVLRLMNQELEFLVPLRLGGVLLDLRLELALVPDKQPKPSGRQHPECCS